MALELKPNWLDNLHIATPCRADWERMEWEDEEGRVRFCRTCEKNVYNISLMSRAEALDLIRAKEGQLCLRLAKRKDGTLITNDCPVGQSKRQTKRRFVGIAGALLIALSPSALSSALRQASIDILRAVPGIDGVIDTVDNSTPVGSIVAWWQDRTAPSNEVMGLVTPRTIPQTSVSPPPESLP
ncbi:MAG TPA: hypothetical protein VGB77_23100 [Abditibacteriaceae bacterium]|jgi:hypothetical protein